MGLYLLLLACMDYHSVGTYFNFAYDWQYGKHQSGFSTVAFLYEFFYSRDRMPNRWFSNGIRWTPLYFHTDSGDVGKVVRHQVRHRSHQKDTAMDCD